MKYVTVALLFLLSIPGFGQDGRGNHESFEYDTPLELTNLPHTHVFDHAILNYGAMNDCTEQLTEPLAFSGFIHTTGTIQTIRWSDNPGQQPMTMVSLHIGPRGDAKAIGLVTKNEYRLVGESFVRFMYGHQQNKLEHVTYINRFKIVGLYDVEYRYHFVTDNPSKSVIDGMELRCRGVE